MQDLLPEGEALRRAVRFVSDALRERPGRPLGPLIDEACRRFDLSPRDCELLADFCRKAHGRPAAERGGGGGSSPGSS